MFYEIDSSAGANPIKLFGVNLPTFCKLDHFIIVHCFPHCTKMVWLTNKSEYKLTLFCKLDHFIIRHCFPHCTKMVWLTKKWSNYKKFGVNFCKLDHFIKVNNIVLVTKR